MVLKKTSMSLNKSLDVITLWHVLEHLLNLHELITQIENKLKPGGTLIIAVPNFKSLDASYYKVFWPLTMC
ncbi:MAG: methyltransferase domain-containing protein [Flavobacteriaceae bacterium]